MADAKFEEVIRLAFETAGTEGIKQAAGMLATMGDVSEETRTQAAALLDTLASSDKAERAVQQYRDMGLSVLDYQRQITAAKARVVELAEAVKQADSPTKAQQRELDKARASVSALVAEQRKEVAQLRNLKTSLEGQGISLRSVGAAQKDVADRTAQAGAQLRDMVGKLKAQRAAERQLQTELAAEASKKRAETAQYDAAVRRLESHLKQAGHAGAEGARETGKAMEQTRGILERFREPLAAIAAYLSFDALKEGVKSIFETGSAFEQMEQKLSGLYGTADKGKEAFEWLKQFTTGTPLKLDETMAAFVRLKKFGIDPMGGALQSLVDYNAKMGGDAAQLQAITEALTKASTKGQIDMRGLIALTDAGVPVFDMLAKATGKTSDEIQNLAQQGLLGADAVQQLIKQMGKAGAGGAAKELEQLSSQWTVFTESIDDFKDRVARGGVMDYFRDQLKALNDWIAQLTADGRLDVYAKRVSDAIVSVAERVKQLGGFIVEHAGQIKKLIEVYAAFKVGRILMELGGFAEKLWSVGRSVIAGTEAVAGLSRGMILFRGILAFALSPLGLVVTGLGAFAVAAKLAADATVDYAVRHSKATAEATVVDQEHARVMRELADQWRQRAKATSEFQETDAKTVEQIAELTEAERDSYKQRLEGYINYSRAVWKEAQLRAIAEGDSAAESKKHVDELKKKYEEAENTAKAFPDATRMAARAAALHVTVGATSIIEAIGKVKGKPAELKAEVDKQFAEIGHKAPEQLGNIALAFANLTAGGSRTARDIRTSFQQHLAALAGEDLHAFQTAAKIAFVGASTDARQSASQMDDYLQTALGRLGVSVEQWGAGATEAGRQNAELFRTVAENANASAATIGAAFDKALADAHTAADANAIGDAMQTAAAKGRVGLDEANRAAASLEARLRALKTAADPLGDSFAALGIKSQRMLDDAADSARKSFNAIVQGARSGQASMDDVRAAFQAYSRVQLDSVANAEPWKQAQVRSALEVQAATLNVTDSIDKMGLSGLDAGSKVASGAHDGAAGMDHLATSTNKAAQATQNLSKSAKAAKEDEPTWHDIINNTRVALNGLSDEMMKALVDLNRLAGQPSLWGDAWNAVFAEWQRQKDTYSEQLAAIEKQNAGYDEMAQRVANLRAQYRYLSDDALRSLAQAQKTLEDNRKRAEDEAKAKRDEARRKSKEAAAEQMAAWSKEVGIDDQGKPSAAGPAHPQRIAIDLTVAASQTSGAVPAQLTGSDVQKVANEVVRQISIARARSNH